MKCWLKCCLRCWSRCCLTIWWSFRRAASNADTSNALASFPVLSKNCTWLWDGQMHWRIFDFAKKLHLTMKRSGALTGFPWCQKNCILMIECIDGFSILSKSCTWLWGNQMHWRVFDFFRCLGYRCSDEMLTVRRRQTGRQADGPQTGRQGETSKLKWCLLWDC